MVVAASDEFANISADEWAKDDAPRAGEKANEYADGGAPLTGFATAVFFGSPDGEVVVED